VTSKAYGGAVDFCFGFDGNLAYPWSLEAYDPRNETTQHVLNLTSYMADTDCTVDYNFTSGDEGNEVYDGYVWVNRTIVVVNEKNYTVGWEWASVLLQHFDIGYPKAGIFYWNTTQTLDWRSLRENGNFDKSAFSFKGMSSWYLGNAIVEKGEEYYLRLWLTVVPTLEDVTHEFFVALKPHSETLEQALASNRFYYLDPWYNGAWNYRKSHIIIAASNAETNYQVRVCVHSGSGTDSGEDVYCGGKCRADFGDIRFTSSDGSTLLDYWIESITANDAVFWVEIAENLSSADRTFYVYYGNMCAETTSDGTSTFPFFDHFADDSLDSNKWMSSGASVSNSEVTITGNPAYIKGEANFGTGYACRTRAKCPGAYGWLAALTTYPGGGTSDWVLVMESTSGNFYQHDSKSGVGMARLLFSPADNNYHVNEIRRISTSKVISYLDASTTNETNTAYIPTVAMPAALYTAGGHTIICDWLVVRKCVDPEPQHGGWGQEENGSSWYNDDWLNRKSHCIHNAIGAGHNYTIRVHVHCGLGTDNLEDVYLHGKCRTDFGDIRFTAGDGVTLLDYWMESKINGNNAVFWVKIADDLSSEDKKIYVYYGNSGATTTSNGTNTFLLYDHFLGSTLDTNKWSKYQSGGTLAVANSICSISLPDFFSKIQITGVDIYKTQYAATRAKVKLANTNEYMYPLMFWESTLGNNIVFFDQIHEYYRTYSRKNGVDTYTNIATPTVGCYHVMDILWQNGEVKYYVDDVLNATHTTNVPDVSLAPSFGGYAPNYATRVLSMDWIFMRKYVSPEPAHGDWGQEEGEGFSSAASIIWRSPGGADWYIDHGWTNETNEAVAVCTYIESLFDAYRNYVRLNRYDGDSVTRSNIFAVTDSCNVYDYATVFTYAHGGNDPINAMYCVLGSPPQCYYIPIMHYRYYPYGGEDNSVYDNELYSYTGSENQKFVFQWTCVQAEEIGGYDADWEDEYGHYYGTGAVALAFAWTRQDYTVLSADGYASPDSTDYCYIGFVGWSKPLSENITYPVTYGSFVEKFYQRVLQYNDTINDALDIASNEMWGCDFGDSDLYNGYWDDVPEHGYWFGKMRVFGNGNNVIT
jgi:hypothetical protein